MPDFFKVGYRQSNIIDDAAWMAQAPLPACHHFAQPIGQILKAHITPEPGANCRTFSFEGCTFQHIYLVNRAVADVLQHNAPDDVLFGPCYTNGIECDCFVTLNTKECATLRGDEHATLKMCDHCGSAVYYEQFTKIDILTAYLPVWPKIMLGRWGHWIIIRSDLLAALEGTLNNAVITPVNIVDKPNDGYPPELSAMPAYFKDAALVAEWNRTRSCGPPPPWIPPWRKKGKLRPSEKREPND